ncbi:hypothetical protein TNCV_4222901 [Trichonephila clavipes]|nr:hypothetical protein TNCV_4222901 [Trichonephila clavipes]
MDNSDIEFSPNSRSNSSSRSSTPKPEKPLSDCERRRNAMERLHKQHIMIDGYKKVLRLLKTLERRNRNSQRHGEASQGDHGN